MRVLTVALSSSCLSLAILAAQQPLQFRAAIDLVQVDVSVLDEARRPLRGLTAADFTILEDGKPQPIAAFTEFVAPDPVAPTAMWMRDSVPDVLTNTGDDGRLVVIVLDDATAPADGGKALAESFREVARAIIDRLSPADRAALIFTMDNRAAQDFTADKSLLRRALPSFSPKFMPDIPAYTVFTRTSTTVVSKISQHLREITGRRKAVIFVSVDPRVNMSLDPLSTTQVASGSYAVMLLRALGSLEKAQQSNITAYSINPRSTLGIAKPLRETLADRVSQEQETATARSFDRPPAASSYMQRLAAETGGITIARPGQLVPGLTQVFRETGSYYVLGFAPADRTGGSRFRTLEVRVDRPGVLVRARNGYFPRPVERSTDPAKAPSPLMLANAGLLPTKGLPLLVSAAPFAIAGKREAAVVVAAAIVGPAPAEATVEEVSLLVQAFTPHGDLRRTVRRDVRVRLVPSPAPAEFEMRARIDLDPGRYEFRIAAISRTQAKSGSVYVSVDVPDFWKVPLSISGVALTTEPATAGAATPELAAVIPVTPTVRRQLDGHRAAAFLRVYQGGGRPPVPVAIQTRIVDSRDNVIRADSETLGPARFGNAREADNRFQLPTGFPPGHYAAIVDATAGSHHASRTVQFEVR